MPVADLRNVSASGGVMSKEEILPTVEESAPVYAVINKAAKNGAKKAPETSALHHNYCNVKPGSGSGEKRLAKMHNYENIDPSSGNFSDESGSHQLASQERHYENTR
jgi:hypothetical protein